LTCSGKHIKPPCKRKINSSVRSIIILCLAVLFFQQEVLFAQVISNTGAAISLSTGVVVNSKDIENTTGTLGNNGTINLSGNYFNAGSTSGNGFYNIIGNWTNFGTFNAGTSTVTLNGITNQTITHGSTGETFYILTINNPGRIVTQVANPGSTLAVLNNLNLTAGTLSLDATTANLTVGGRATIAGTLLFNNITTQRTTISDILSGSGLINMSGGNLPHVLNLAGATNAIGTFTTSPTSSSTVNYNGTTQTVFPALNYRNLTISNSGIKTLQGNSTVGIDLNISGGTFDLGTTTTILGVLGATTINGSLSFNGTTTKTVSLTGNLSGTGSIDMSGGNQPHLLYLNGATNSIGIYASGTQSTVDYVRNGNQTVFTSDDYRNLTVSGIGVKTLYSDITAKGVLTMSSGDINSNGNTLKITNSAISAINRTAGKVIGKLQRAIGTLSAEYLYPIGSATVYNPLKITFQNLISGPLTAQFKTEDIGTAGLPLDDDGNEIWDRFTTGYWTLTSVTPMASNNYDVNLNYSGFSGVDPSSRIIKRTNGGNLELDGKNDSITIVPEIKRDALINGISTTTTDFAIGKGRPLITSQPVNIDICEGSNAVFQVRAKGRGPLTYQWQVNTGSGWTNIVDGGVYSGSKTRNLTITGAGYIMNGFLYRCIVTDGSGNSNITNSALLTVNKIPIATSTPSAQYECPGVAFANIVLGTSNDVPGTRFAWTRNNPAGITTSLPLSGNTYTDISGTFSNTTDAPITVTFTIRPTGPGTTYCIGNNITATVTVDPVPRVLAVSATIQCDSTITNLRLQSPSIFASGLPVTFKYTVTTTGLVTGYTSPISGLPNNYFITNKLVNQTDNYQVVTYGVVPVSPVGCADGPVQNISVTVNPTPRVIPINSKDNICDNRNAQIALNSTDITLTTPSVMTSGVIRFDYTVSVTGAPGIIVGNTSPGSNLTPGQKITFSYRNNSDTIQSVFYFITPKVVGLGCPAGKVNTPEVKIHASPLQSIVITKPLTCDGGSDASLRGNISRGANPYQIIWDGPFNYHEEGSTNNTNIHGGRYDLRVTDNLGCANSDFIYVEGAYLDSYFDVTADVSCPGYNDGAVRVRVNNTSTGTAPFEYWIVRDYQDTVIYGTLAVTNLFNYHNGLIAGDYKLHLRDFNGCTDNTSEVNVIQPELITVTFTRNQYPGGYNISCKGYNDGSVWINTISGGNGGYTYEWSTINGTITGNNTLNRLDNITAGTYYLKITDIKGCEKTDSVIITEPNGIQLATYQLSSSADSLYNVSCNGGNNGSIKITLTGGSGSYNHSWSGTDGFTSSTQDIFNLVAGIYTDTIRDVSNASCILMPLPTFTLAEPAALNIGVAKSLSTDGSYNINCNGGTGSIDLTVTGGSVGNYQYKWTTTDGSGIIDGQEDQNALTAGTYHVVVEDLNLCKDSIDITLTQPAPLSTTLIPKHITCQSPGFDNGSIDLTVSGGVGPYLFAWSNGATTEDISNLTQGYYKVTVTDLNGCQKTDSVSVDLPPPIIYTSTLSLYNSYNISCYGLSDGWIQITTTSGKAPFTYSWQYPDGLVSSLQNISGLKAGQYNLQITDSNLCTATGTFNLTEPGKLSMTITLSSSLNGGYNINCAGDSTGSINVDAVSQVGTTDYLWSDGATGKLRSDIPAGTYQLIITDQNNCHVDSTIILTEPDSIKISFDVTQAFCPDSPDGEIRLMVTGGVIGTDYSYKWSDNSTGQTISNILKGLYWVTVTDANNCSLRDSVKMEPLNETCLIIPNAISPNDDNINDVWNIGMIYLYPQIEIKIFNRWGELLWKSEKGYPRPWDGRSNGTPLPIDSYHYVIDLHNGSKPIIGNVTIVK